MIQEQLWNNLDQWIKSGIRDSGDPLSKESSRADNHTFSQLQSILDAHSKGFVSFGECLLNEITSSHSTIIEQEFVTHFKEYLAQQSNSSVLNQFQIPTELLSLVKNDPSVFSKSDIFSLINRFSEQLWAGQKNSLQPDFADTQKKVTEYQNALIEHIDHHKAINNQAIQALLLKLNTDSKEINSLQELHRLWTESYESIYRHSLLDEQFQSSYGRLSNALIELQKQLHDFRNQLFQNAGLASKTGLDSALQRQQQFRKEMRTTKREMVAMKNQISSMKLEIEQLRSMVNSLVEPKTDTRKSK